MIGASAYEPILHGNTYVCFPNFRFGGDFVRTKGGSFFSFVRQKDGLTLLESLVKEWDIPLVSSNCVMHCLTYVTGSKVPLQIESVQSANSICSTCLPVCLKFKPLICFLKFSSVLNIYSTHDVAWCKLQFSDISGTAEIFSLKRRMVSLLFWPKKTDPVVCRISSKRETPIDHAFIHCTMRCLAYIALLCFASSWTA